MREEEGNILLTFVLVFPLYALHLALVADDIEVNLLQIILRGGLLPHRDLDLAFFRYLRTLLDRSTSCPTQDARAH